MRRSEPNSLPPSRVHSRVSILRLWWGRGWRAGGHAGSDREIATTGHTGPLVTDSGAAAVPAAGHPGGRSARASPPADHGRCRFHAPPAVARATGSAFRGRVGVYWPGTRSPPPYRVTCRPALPDRGRVFLPVFFRPPSRFNPSGTDVGGPAAVRPPGRGRRPGAHGHAMRTSGRRYVPPMVPRPAAQQEAAGHHHPTEPASGCFPATTSKRPC